MLLLGSCAGTLWPNTEQERYLDAEHASARLSAADAGAKLVVVVPVGPRDDPADTVQSVLRYTAPEAIVLIDDTRGSGIALEHGKIVVIPAVSTSDRYGHLGGLWVNIATGFRYVAENLDFDLLLRIDTDALVCGPGLVEAAVARFAKAPMIGALGSYRIGPDGLRRDFSPVARELRRATGVWGGLRQPRVRTTLRGLLARAPGYEPGEHALGGVMLYRGQMLREMARRGLLDFPQFAGSFLGEDHIFALLTLASGYKIGDFGGPGDPIAARWRDLPAAPEDLLSSGKLAVHSVRSWGTMTEQQIREYFALHRQT
jgi:hypothetical protein